MFKREHLQAVRHKGERSMQDVYVTALTTHGNALAQYGVTTPAHRAMILGQVAHETGGLTILRENMNYTANRIRQVWPSRPEAVQFAGKPRELANSVYGSRMGNRKGTDDGYNYRGKGMPQHTGRDGYEAVARISGLPLNHPPAEMVVTDPLAAIHGLGAFWKWKRLDTVTPDLSEASIIAVTKRWNGGRIGLADRIVRVRKAAKALGQSPMPIAARPTAKMVAAEAPAAARVAAGGAAVATGGGAVATAAPSSSAPAAPAATDPTALVAAVVLGTLIIGIGAVLAFRAWGRVITALADARAIEAGDKAPDLKQDEPEGDGND